MKFFTLTEVVRLRIAWQGRLEGRTLPDFTVLSVEPEPGYPLGRKGLLLAAAWEQLQKPGSDGMLLLDGDVVIDPLDLKAMITSVVQDTSAVWTAPVKLWPRATGLPGWVWGHRQYLPEGTPPAARVTAGQCDIDDPVMFTFCFTYLPARLIDAAVKAGMAGWMYPKVDTGMWQTARDLGIPVRVVRCGCSPRHLNY